MSKTILIADDDSTMMQLFSLSMERRDESVSVRSAENGEEAIASIMHQKPDVLVLDLRMPKKDGFAVLEYLQEHAAEIPVVILTNYKTDEYVARCEHFGVKEYLVKHELKIDRIIEKVSGYLAI